MKTFADLFTEILDFGYTKTELVLISISAICLGCQINAKVYSPLLFWAIMTSSSVAGTCVSDFIDRTLELGYPLGTVALLAKLFLIFGILKLSGKHMNVAGAMTRRAEAFYV